MKKITAILLAVLVLFSLISCTRKGSSSIPSSNNTASLSSNSSDETNPSSDGQDQTSEEQSSSPSSNEPNGSSASSTSSEASSGNSTSQTDSSGIGTSSAVSSKPVSSFITSADESSSDGSSSGTVSTPDPDPIITFTPVDPEDYSCYKNLTEDQRIIYNTIMTAGSNMEVMWIDLPTKGKVTTRDVSLAFYALETDHPELFWLPSQYYIKTEGDDVSFIFVGEDSEEETPESSTYLVKKSEKAAMQQKLRAEVEKIKAQVTATEPYEIELQLHDILCDRVAYYTGSQNDPMIWTAYGALVNGLAVCEGYARAYQLLLYEFGINSTLATGIAGGEGHMWNVVEIGGKHYNVDVTWDDRDGGKSPAFHAFFNLTDTEIRKTHNPHPEYSLIKDEVFESGEAVSYNFALPECRDTSLSFFVKNSAVFNAGDEQALAGYIISKGGTVEIKYTERPDLNKVNTVLKNKGSALRIFGWQKKTEADVLILEVV